MTNIVLLIGIFCE